MPLILSGDTGVPASGMPTGSVIQTVQVDISASFNTTSTSFVATNLTGAITPISSSNKILVTVNLGTIYGNSATVQPRWTLYRNSTDLAAYLGSLANFGESFSAAGGITTPGCFSYLDSPATTSSTTYTIYMRVNTGTGYIGFDTSKTNLILQEIKG